MGAGQFRRPERGGEWQWIVILLNPGGTIEKDLDLDDARDCVDDRSLITGGHVFVERRSRRYRHAIDRGQPVRAIEQRRYPAIPT
jgi:hypothetical protein